jgi:hypothetical protein
MTRIEYLATIADRNWWDAFGKRFGWRLCGFTYRSHASFYLQGTVPRTDAGAALSNLLDERQGQVFQISGEAAVQIMTAMDYKK